LKKLRNYILFFEDIQLSMNRIQNYLSEFDFPGFKKDFKTVDAVIRNFEIIGEAVKNIPQEVKDRYPDFPWKEMYRLRNRITHEYFGIDYKVIWRIAKDYLPGNLEDLNEIIKIEKARTHNNN